VTNRIAVFNEWFREAAASEDFRGAVVDPQLCIQSRCCSDDNLTMPSPFGLPLIGNDRPDIANDAADKIGAAFSKGRRVSATDLSCVLSGEKMTKQTHQHSNGSNGAESTRIWKARNFILEHAEEELSLTRVAMAANTSPNYFSEKFKEATGTNFVEYVARTRYEKAAGMLRDPKLRVSEIGFAVGFQSLSQFNRVFKRLSGKSPSEYRAAQESKKKQAAD
jgi:AraC-like DNA-binding protein